MCREHHDVEYKDYHKDIDPKEKNILAKLFKEISAFANSSGGEIVVGKEDKTGDEYKQPNCIYTWLENDRLTTSINKMSDNLIVFNSLRVGDLIIIKVKESEDVISAIADSKDVNKGDCFVRENHESIKITGNKLKKLIEKKLLSEEQKSNALRKIVHYKMSNNMSHANQMNIFDSLFVSLESPHSYINMVFDALVKNEFIGSYRLPLSKYSTMQMHLETFAIKKVFNSELIKNNSDAFNEMMQSKDIKNSFFIAYKNDVLNSPQLKAYIHEYKGLIEGL